MTTPEDTGSNRPSWKRLKPVDEWWTEGVAAQEVRQRTQGDAVVPKLWWSPTYGVIQASKKSGAPPYRLPGVGYLDRLPDDAVKLVAAPDR